MNHQEQLYNIFKQNGSDTELQWYQKMDALDLQEKKKGFVMAHRHIARVPLGEVSIHPHDSPYPVDLSKWTKDQLVRTLVLLSMDEGDQNDFIQVIEDLFQTADNREAQAIYAALPFFNYAPVWTQRATEAIRSNVGLIFDAMAFNNPYPARYFDDTAWNQLVLKTIFNDKSIWNILGLEDRRNQSLAVTISDFAHERWAAGRTLSAEVWFLTVPFPSTRYWQDTYQLLNSETSADRNAGYLLWKAHADSAPENFTETFQSLFDDFKTQTIEWGKLEGQDQS